MPYGRDDRDSPSRGPNGDRQRLSGRWIQDDETGYLRRRFDDESDSDEVYRGDRESRDYGAYYGGPDRRGGGHAFDFARRDTGRFSPDDRGDYRFESQGRFSDPEGYATRSDGNFDQGYDARSGREFNGDLPRERRFQDADRIGRYVSAEERSGERPRSGSFRGKGPKGYVRSDERIKEDVSDRLTDDETLDASDITVDVSAGEVTLSGYVDSRQAKRTAEDCAEQCIGVLHVQNNLRVRMGNGGERKPTGQATDL